MFWWWWCWGAGDFDVREGNSSEVQPQNQGLLRHQAETCPTTDGSWENAIELEYIVVFLVYIIDGIVYWIDEVIFIEWHADLSLPSEQSDLLQMAGQTSAD
jgi:hypothetical protein